MWQDLLVQVTAQDGDLPLAGYAAGHRVADGADAPLQAPAQHRVMVDDLPDLLGAAFVGDGHQAPSFKTC